MLEEYFRMMVLRFMITAESLVDRKTTANTSAITATYHCGDVLFYLFKGLC